jgi:hypothetical protein
MHRDCISIKNIQALCSMCSSLCRPGNGQPSGQSCRGLDREGGGARVGTCLYFQMCVIRVARHPTFQNFAGFVVQDVAWRGG